MSGVVYTETVVHAAPQAFVAEAPYQLVIVDQEDGNRVTGRIEGERVKIGDRVDLIEARDGVPFFRHTGTSGDSLQQDDPSTKVLPQETL